MKSILNLKKSFAVALALAIPVLNACSSTDNPLTSAASDVCCTDFKVGADLSTVDFGVDASISGEYLVFAQAGSDFGSVANAMIDDITNSCKAIATDLGVAAADAATADGTTAPGARAQAWCTLATTLLGTARGGATITVAPPTVTCEASVSAHADCQAKCSGSAMCNVQANPPTCTGGTLEVSCDAACDGTVTPGGIDCQGSCSVAASGSCTAQGGVMCAGKCQGTCSGATDAQGNCNGMCQGSCSAVAPMAACSGTFSGKCTGSCTATSPSVKVQCSAGCNANATPIKCTGGKLEGGCMASAQCSGSCDASANAKANCNVTPLQITATVDTPAIDAAIATLQVNLPKLYLAVQARGKALGDLATTFASAGISTFIDDPTKIGVKGTACGLLIAGTISDSATNVTAALSGGGTFITAL